MVKKLTALVMAALIALAVLAGCSEKEKETEAETTAEVTQDSKETEPDAAQPSDENAGPAQPEDGEDEFAGFTADDYSNGFLDNGFMEGVKALDYIEIPDFSKVELPAEALEVDEDEIDSQIYAMLSVFPIQVTDRAIEDGDQVNIDYSGSMDGVKFDGGTAQGADVTAGSEEFIDDFLTQIIGHKPGETMDVEVTFPDPYYNNPEFAGKDAVFEVKINYISEIPELTDEWVKENREDVNSYFFVDNIETADDVHQFLYDYYYNYNREVAIYTYMIDAIEVGEVPEIVREIAKMNLDADLYNRTGMRASDLIDIGYLTEEGLEQEVIRGAKMLLLFQGLSESENWDEITEADFAEITGTTENDGFIEYYGKGYIANNVLHRRAIEFMKEAVESGKPEGK